MSAVKEKWTARGTGKCPKCSFTYSTFRKPPNCFQCNFFLGGKYVKILSAEKRKNWTIQVQWKCVHLVETTCIQWNSLAGMMGVFSLFLTWVHCVIIACARAFVQVQQHLVRPSWINSHVIILSKLSSQYVQWRNTIYLPSKFLPTFLSWW